MSVVETEADLPGDQQGELRIECSVLAEEFLQAQPVDILHDDVVVVVRRSKIDYTDYVLVVQTGGCFCLDLESFREIGIGYQM